MIQTFEQWQRIQRLVPFKTMLEVKFTMDWLEEHIKEDRPHTNDEQANAKLYATKHTTDVLRLLRASEENGTSDLAIFKQKIFSLIANATDLSVAIYSIQCLCTIGNESKSVNDV